MAEKLTWHLHAFSYGERDNAPWLAIFQWFKESGTEERAYYSSELEAEIARREGAGEEVPDQFRAALAAMWETKKYRPLK
jgi:hypothetical protein